MLPSPSMPSALLEVNLELVIVAAPALSLRKIAPPIPWPPIPSMAAIPPVARLLENEQEAMLIALADLTKTAPPSPSRAETASAVVPPPTARLPEKAQLLKLSDPAAL